MKTDENGNKHFEGLGEAIWAQRNYSSRLIRWLHECMEQGNTLPSFSHYRSLINDWANITARWILTQNDRIAYLQQKVMDLTDEVLRLRAETRRTSHPSSPRGG